MKISVIIATYNQAQWLAQSIESALAQTLKPHEVIVVDYRSTDDTRQIAARYPVRLMEQPGRGVSDARNFGVANSSGDWVAFLDSDDYWLPQKLERQAGAIRDEAFCYCGATKFYSDGHTEAAEYVDAPEALTVLRRHNFIDTSAGMVRRDAFAAVGGFNIRSCAGEEWELWLKLSRKYTFIGVPERLLMYRVTGQGLSVNPVSVLGTRDFIVAAGTAGMPPLRRWIEARRMRSVRTTLAAIKYRDNGEHNQTLRYAWEAFRYWPSPFYDKAFKVLLLELRRRFFPAR